MAEITLRAYIKEIDDLVEHEQLDEAIAYCRHILETYPKHLETYRLLGKAYLEAKRYGDAADLFQRVLSAVPDDFVAHIGMAIVREDEGNLDASIWHMERAFETNPANPAIQQELRRLFGRRDGLEPHKVRLTRGALARMYAHGELYPQAIAELRSALQEDRDRPDLQVLLANLYWRTNQRAEASKVSARVIEKLPYCRDANRIIAAALQADSKVDAAAAYHRRLASLDPYAAFVETAMVDPQGVDANSVHLQKLIWQPGQPLPSAEPARRDWASSVGEGVRAPKEPPPVAGPVPSWLESVSSQPAPAAPAAAAAVADAAGAAVHPFADAKSPSEPIPDWMRGAGWTEATSEAVEGPVSFSDEELSVAEKPPEPAELAPADIPDWLMDIAPPEAAEPVPPDEAPTPIPAALPDWGAEAAAPAKSAPVDTPPEAHKPVIPEPAAEAAPASPASEPIPEPEADQGAPQLPPWLDVPTPGATDTIVTWLGDRSPRTQATTPASAPEWIGDTGPLDRLEKAEAAEDKETPAWLGESEFSEEAEAAPGPLAEPAIPAWLSGVAQAASIEESKVPDAAAWQGEPVAQTPAGTEDEELLTPSTSKEKAPDWLRAIAETGSAPAPEPATSSSGESAPNWLEGLIEPAAAAASVAPAGGAGDDWSGLRAAEEAPSQAAIPETDWLSGLSGPADASPEPAPRSAAPAPEWLRGIAEPPEEAETPQASQPPAPDWLRGLAEPASRDEAEPAKPGAPAPEWLRGIAEPEPAAQAAPAESLPDDWRSGLLSTGPEPAPEFPETPEDAAWLAGIAGTSSAAESTQEPAGIAGPAAAAGAGIAPPDWLSELRSAEAPEPGAEEQVDWMHAPTEPASPDEGQAGIAESGEWLRGLVVKREANRPGTGGTDWLKGLLQTDGEAAEAPEPPSAAPEPEQPAVPAAAEASPPEAPVPEAPAAETPAAAEPAKPETPAWLQEFAEAGGQAVSPTDDTIVTRRRPADRLEWLPAEPPSTPAPPAPTPPAAASLADASAAGELDDDEVYRWLETLAASQDDTESIPFPRVLESGTQPLPEIPAGVRSGPLPEGPEESLEWLERLAGETGAQTEPTPPEPEEEAPDWLKSLAQAGAIAVAPSMHEPPEPEPAPVEEQASDWVPVETGALSGSVHEELVSDWPPMAEETPAEPVPAEQPTDWLSFSGELPAEAEAMSQASESFEESEEVSAASASEATAMDWLAPVLAEPITADELAPTGEGTPEWLAPEAVETPSDQAGAPAADGLEAEASAWLFEAATPESSGPVSAELSEPAMEAPSEPDWMRPAVEPEPAAESPQADASIPEWLREPVEPPSMTIPEEPITAGPVEPIVFEGRGEEAGAEPVLSEEPAEPAATPVAFQPEPTPASVAEAPVLPVEAPMPAPRPAVRVKQVVRPDQLLEMARQSLASGDVDAAAQAYAKLVKKRSGVDEVISDLQGALELAPNVPAMWQLLGDAYMRANLTAEAIEAYRRGLSSL